MSASSSIWLLLTVPILLGSACTMPPEHTRARPDNVVGPSGGTRVTLPVNQTLTPAGRNLPLPEVRPQLLALSPDARALYVAGNIGSLLVLDPISGNLRQRVPLPADTAVAPLPGVSPNLLQPTREDIASYTGLIVSADSRRVFLSNVHGSVKHFLVGTDGLVTGAGSFALPPANAPRRAAEIPAGLALSADQRRLYVCGNLSNRLLELDAATGALLRSFDVGVAPFDVVLVGRKAYVSNWGGRRPGPNDVTGPAGRGTVVRVDPIRHIASEGSVTVIDLDRGAIRTELLTGLHASALAASPDGRYVACANAGSDRVSVISTRTDQVVETILVKATPAELLAASPNALCFAPDGRTLYVANGTQNAIAVIRFEPSDRESELLGLIPVGWFPAAVALHPRERTLLVANLKGLPATGRPAPSGQPSFNSLQNAGSLSIVPLPARGALPTLSESVMRNLRHDRILASGLPPRPGQPPRPVPERIGEPSVFRHVIYLIKENRTYDQVLGDLPGGNGDASLCVFGGQFTPNQHQLARDFVLLDNTYCAGILSADGHQWSTTAFATDYMERSFAGFPRSYPDGMGVDEADALAYSPAGFLWDNALAHGRTLRDYGEFAAPLVRWRDSRRPGSPGFADCYAQWQGRANDVIIESYAMVASLQPHLPTSTVGWSLEVPDQFRADFFIRELKSFATSGTLPDLTLICLPADHTSGTVPGAPTPAASIADNDLAFGRIVEAVSHSRFWPETVIFAIEDDPQDGWDHVSGYRTTAYCISPYTRRHAVVSTQYNTTSVIRTIEQILGLPPMNEFDASAAPMSDCFTATPDLTPYVAVTNRVPLDQLNPPASALRDRTLRRDAEVSARLNFREVDRAPEDVLNRILWRAMKGSRAPYPEWAVRHDVDDHDS